MSLLDTFSSALPFVLTAQTPTPATFDCIFCKKVRIGVALDEAPVRKWDNAVTHNAHYSSIFIYQNLPAEAFSKTQLSKVTYNRKSLFRHSRSPFVILQFNTHILETNGNSLGAAKLQQEKATDLLQAVHTGAVDYVDMHDLHQDQKIGGFREGMDHMVPLHSSLISR